MEVINLPERLRKEADYLHHLAAIDFSRAVAEMRAAADAIERLQDCVMILERKLHPRCTCDKCLGVKNYYETAEAAREADDEV